MQAGTADDSDRAGALDRDPVVAQLRKIYGDVAAEPLPERLMTLLEQLDEAERKR